MGKQINFYMDDKIKQDFINFLDAEGYVFYLIVLLIFYTNLKKKT